jgi:hypothetical protein
MTPFLPTFFIASEMMLPISLSPFAEIVATWKKKKKSSVFNSFSSNFLFVAWRLNQGPYYAMEPYPQLFNLATLF